MNVYRVCGLSVIGVIALMEPAFAVEPVPGPIAGVGLPALAIVGAAYWVGRKLLARMK